jgi:hypothetical protein
VTIDHARNIHVLQRRRENGNADAGGDEGKRRHYVRRFLSDAGGEACRMTRGKDIVARSSQCPRLAVHYEGLVGKILQWKDSSGLAAGECMALGQSHDHRFHQHWMEDEAFQFSNTYPAENGVEPIAFYLSNQLDSVALGQCHRHPWKALAELADYARYQGRSSASSQESVLSESHEAGRFHTARVKSVAPTGSKASPNVRYANSDRICASQRTDVMGRFCCKSLRAGSVELEFETIESG